MLGERGGCAANINTLFKATRAVNMASALEHRERAEYRERVVSRTDVRPSARPDVPHYPVAHTARRQRAAASGPASIFCAMMHARGHPQIPKRRQGCEPLLCCAVLC